MDEFLTECLKLAHKNIEELVNGTTRDTIEPQRKTSFCFLVRLKHVHSADC